MQAYLQKHSQYIEQAARWHHLCSGGQAHKLVAVPRHRKTVITDPNNPLKTEQTVQYCVVVGAEAADAAGATRTHNSSSLGIWNQRAVSATAADEDTPCCRWHRFSRFIELYTLRPTFVYIYIIYISRRRLFIDLRRR